MAALHPVQVFFPKLNDFGRNILRVYKSVSGFGLQGPAVNIHIFPYSTAPGKIDSHSIKLVVTMKLLLLKKHEGFAHGLSESAAGVIPKLYAISFRSVFLDINNGVIQAASDADDRNSAVSETIHLVETARLKSGWHQEEVAAGFDAMRNAFVEAQMHGGF